MAPRSGAIKWLYSFFLFTIFQVGMQLNFYLVGFFASVYHPKWFETGFGRFYASCPKHHPDSLKTRLTLRQL